MIKSLGIGFIGLVLALVIAKTGHAQSKIFYSGHPSYQEDIANACRASVWAKSNGPFEYWFEVYKSEQLWFTSAKGLAVLRDGEKTALLGDSLFEEGHEISAYGNYRIALFCVEAGDTTTISQSFRFRPKVFPLSTISAEVVRGEGLRAPKLAIGADDSLYSYRLVDGTKNKEIGPDGTRIPFKPKKEVTLVLLMQGVPICDTVLNGMQLVKLGWENKTAAEKSAIKGKSEGVVVPDVPKPLMPELPAYQKPQFGTTVYFEAKTSTLDSLYGFMPNNYLRTGISPTAELMGIPFKGDFYYTTESGTGYDLNSFSVGIDQANIKDQIRARAFQNGDSVNQLLSNNQFSNLQLTKQLKRYALDRDDLLEQKKALEQEAYSEIHTRGDSIRKAQTDSAFAGIHHRMNTDKVDAGKAKSDQAKKRLQMVNDSLEQMNQRIEEIQSKSAELQSEYSELQEESAKWRKVAKNPYALAPDDVPTKEKALGYLSKIDQLQVGRHNVDFLEEVGEGVNIRGATAAYASKRMYVKSSKGRYSNSLDILADQNELSYDKRLFGLRLGRGAPTGNHLHGIIMKQNLDQDGQFENYVSAISSQREVGKMASYSVVLASSSRVYFSQPTRNVFEGALDLSSKNYFFKGKLEGEVWKNANVFMTYTQVGANFNSAVSPFLRTDRSTINTGVETSIGDHFDISLGYQREEGIDNSNNLANGMSFDVLFTSVVLPTIQVSYLPFQQTIDTKGSQQVARNDFATLSVLGFKNFDLGRKRKLKILTQYMRSEYSLGLQEDAQLLEQINATANLDLSTKLQLHGSYGYALINTASQNTVGSAGLRFTIVDGLSHQLNFAQNYAPLDDATRTTFSIQNDFTKGIFSLSLIGGYGDYINNPFVGTAQELFAQLRCSVRI